MVRKANKSILISFLFLFLAFTNLLSAQDWTKQEKRDRWNDIIGYTYMQPVFTSAIENKTIPIGMMFCWENKNLDVIYILSVTQDTPIHSPQPGKGFINERITLSLRRDGNTRTFYGTTEIGWGSYSSLAMFFNDSNLVNLLHGSGQWDFLIEGNRWYIRGSIEGNLPNELLSEYSEEYVQLGMDSDMDFNEYLPFDRVSDLPKFNENEIMLNLVYPPSARRSGIEGRVTLELFVDKEGRVQRVLILREEPEGRGFGEAAVKAFTGIVGTPAMANGEAVAVRFRFSFLFTIR